MRRCGLILTLAALASSSPAAHAGFGLDAGPVWVSEADFVQDDSPSLLGQVAARIGGFGKANGHGVFADLAYMLGAARAGLALQRNFGASNDWLPFVTVNGGLFAAIDYPMAFTGGAGVGVLYRAVRVELRASYVGSPSQGQYGPLGLIEAKIGVDLAGRPR